MPKNLTPAKQVLTYVRPLRGCKAACKTHAMRPSRVIYVENDPALLGIMTTWLSGYSQIDLLGTYLSPADALDRDVISRADVALLDLNLGPTNLSGIELGIAMRSLNEHIGIVIYSQHSMVDPGQRVPEAMRQGWSFIAKSPAMNLDDVVRVLVETARGMSNGFLEANSTAPDVSGPSLDQLTSRQRVIMSLMSTGVSAKSIAEQVGCSYEALRQELTLCYRVLAPSTSELEDRRIKAILTYLELAGRPT